ncbi:hypothetical protein [Pseudomonas sp. SCPG-7]|uniref:hypothetical protein n=1 Tax=Pseudomonas sp. SCPG-7 TaxID=1961714 RepID=UPI00111E4162|nr:hypothetical protein [Pseudomonas sp. SCPG-7]
MAVCALCKKESKLIRSHLIPKAAYKAARVPTGGGGGLVKVLTNEGSAFYSDEQVVADLLCSSCEDLFSKKGEKVVGELWGRELSFPLLEALSAFGPIAVGQRFDVFSPDALSKRERDALFYFAVSVFWRANVWPWERKKDRYVGALGPRYELSFREFLLTGKDLDNCYLLLTVNSSDALRGLIAFPVQNKINRATVHIFDVLGLKFSMVVGGHVPPEIKKPFVELKSNLLVLTSPLEQAPDFLELVKYVQRNVRPRGRLLSEGGRLVQQSKFLYLA